MTVDEFQLPYGMGRIEVFRDPRQRWLGKPRARIVKLASYNMQPETPHWLMANMLLHRRPHHASGESVY